jgi:hypothetical protein
MRRYRDPWGRHVGREAQIVHILGNVKIEQLERFIGVFSTAGAEARGRHDNRGAQLFRVAGEEGRVVLLKSSFSPQ